MFARLAMDAPELVRLDLCFKCDCWTQTSNVWIEGFLSNGAHWPKLKHVRLDGIHSTQDTLQNFLGAHAKTEQALTLVDISLGPRDIGTPDRDNQDSWTTFIIFL